MAKKKDEPEVKVPKDEAEADEFVSRIGALDRMISDATSKEKARELQLKNELTDLKERCEREIKTLVSGLLGFYEANSGEPTEGAKRSIELKSGIIGKRFNDWKVELRKKVDSVVAMLLRDKSLSRFVRTEINETLNRDAMTSTEDDRVLAASVEGVNIVQEEVFYVTPLNLTSDDTTRDVRKLTVSKRRVKH